MFTRIWIYLKTKWLYLLIVLALIGIVYIWWSWIKINIDVINGILLTLATIAIGLFAWRSYRLERTRIKIELYDKRLTIYKALREILSHLNEGGFYILNNERLKLIIRQSKYLFPFDKNIQAFIYEIVTQWNSLELFKNKDDKENIKKTMVILNGLELDLDQKFEKYLRIE